MSTKRPEKVGLQTKRLSFGRHELWIACRADPGQEEEMAAERECRVVSTDVHIDTVGWDIWASATHIMGCFLAAFPGVVEKKNVVELGAGVGILSLLAAKLGALRVVATDYASTVNSIAMMNVEQNGVAETCTVAKYDWDDDVEIPHVAAAEAVILGSDLLYSSSCARKLHTAAHRLLSRHRESNVLLLSHEVRHSVTWGLDKTPLVETTDSVLQAFLSHCVPLRPDLPSSKPEGEEKLFGCVLPIHMDEDDENRVLFSNPHPSQSHMTTDRSDGCPWSWLDVVDTSQSGQTLILAFSFNPAVLYELLGSCMRQSGAA